MKPILIFFILNAMMATEMVKSQKTYTPKITSEVAGQLPADSLGKAALGLAGPVTGVSHNLFFVAGGANFPEKMPWDGGKKIFYKEGFIYKKQNDKLQLLPQRFQLPFNIAYPAVCQTSKGIFFAGGENENGLSDKAWLMNWDATAQKAVFTALPALPFAMANAVATFVKNKIYVAGGETASETINQFIYLDFTKLEKGWQKLTNLPQPTSHSVIANVCTQRTEQLILCGGRKKNSNGISTFYADVFKYNISKNKWEAIAALPYTLAAGTGAAYKKNKILLFGGDKGISFHQTELLIAAISKENNEPKKQELILEKNKIQQNHPGFSKEVLLYQTKTNSWQAVGQMATPTPVTTTAVVWEDVYFIPSGEIKAGVRSPLLLMIKNLKP